MRKLLLLCFLIVIAGEITACDICGCSAGNYFIGPFPQFKKHFFGVRYSFREYNSMVANDKLQFSHDFYQTAELWGGYNISKKWQIMGFVPYNINKQHSDDGLNTNNGIGDITLLANYKVFDKRNRLTHRNRISQQLLLGAGIKLPTGKFAADPEEILPDANNQPGSGSLDWVINALYTYHINDWGLNTSVTYKINTSADNFHFGNRLSSSVFVFHSFDAGKAVINPNAGVLYDKFAANKLNKEKVDDTGGHLLLGSLGTEVNFSKIALGCNLQLPLQQNISENQTEAKCRGMAHITFTF